MDLVVTLVALVATVLATTALCARFDWSAPLTLIVVGIIGSYLPFIPDLELRPEVVLFGLLPPLLYAAALQTSLVDFNNNRRPILLLSVGLVAFTTAGIAVLVHGSLSEAVDIAQRVISALSRPHPRTLSPACAGSRRREGKSRGRYSAASGIDSTG